MSHKAHITRFFSQYRRSDLPKLLGLAVIYALLAKIVLTVALYHNNLTSLWLPGGLGLAALLLYGKKYWIGVFIGAFSAGIITGDSFWLSLFIAVGNTLESVLGAWLLTRKGKFDYSLIRLHDYFRLIFLAGVVSTLTSAVIGVTSLLLAGITTWQTYPGDFLIWWLGDALGIVLLAPALLVWQRLPYYWPQPKILSEGALLLLLTFFAGQIILCGQFSTFFAHYTEEYMLFIFGAWAAMRFGRHGVSIILLILLVQGVYGVTHHIGYFGHEMDRIRQSIFWLYFAQLSVMNMILALNRLEQQGIEQNLVNSDHRYRSLLHNASDAILIANQDGILEEVNQSAEKLLGYSHDEIRDSSVEKIHPAEEMPKVRQHFKDIFGSGSFEPVETKIVRKDGKIVEIEVRPTLVEISGRKLAQGIFIDLTHRKRIEQLRREDEKAQRDTLVREVHHRIKNNLQGVTGVLRQFALNNPALAEPLNQAISQVQSVAVIHGLQGQASLAKVRVCELTLAISAGIESLWQKPVTVEIPDAWIPCTIAESEAVPLALVLNELILNAIKHGAQSDHVKISFQHAPSPESIKLTIQNTCPLPVELDMENTNALGIGLQLVASLLPKVGARLTWEQHRETVVTTLELNAPIISLESIPSNEL